MSLAGWRDKGDVHKRLAKLKLLTCVHDCAKAIRIISVVDFIIMIGSLFRYRWLLLRTARSPKETSSLSLSQNQRVTESRWREIQ